MGHEKVMMHQMLIIFAGRVQGHCPDMMGNLLIYMIVREYEIEQVRLDSILRFAHTVG
jgi:hypothetical protein